MLSKMDIIMDIRVYLFPANYALIILSRPTADSSALVDSLYSFITQIITSMTSGCDIPL
jgi:hypothetical protein